MMPKHDYSPGEALDLLLRKINEHSPVLGERIRVAIDSGKDVQVRDELVPFGQRAKRSPRYYRKNRPYTDQEALRVALSVLQAHLVETRMFSISANNEFKAAGIAPPKPALRGKEAHQMTGTVSGIENMMIEIEVEPETVHMKKESENQTLETVPESALESLRMIFKKFQELTSFGEEDHGYPN